MGIMLTGFLGGAAKGVTETIDEEEKRAATMAQLQAKSMFDNYQKVKTQNTELANKLKGGIDFLKGSGIAGSEEQYFKATKNPILMSLLQEKIKAGADPSNLNLGALVGEAESLSGKSASEAIDRHLDLSQQTYTKPDIAPSSNFVKNFGAAAGEAAFNQSAAAMGVSPDILRATSTYKQPRFETGTGFNISSLASLEEQRKEVGRRLIAAQKNNDEAALSAAKEDALRIKVAEDLTTKHNKTEDQIQTDLRNQITSSTDPKEKALLTAELRQRQVLSKLPGEGQEKISQANLITVASKAVTAAISDKLTPGTDFIIVQNPDGSTSQQVKSLGAAKVFNEATEAGRKAVVKEMTVNGKPRDQMSRNALISIGVGFDENGRAVVPKANTATENIESTGTAPSPPKSTVPAAVSTVTNQRRMANEAISKGADRAAVAAKFKQTTGQDF